MSKFIYFTIPLLFIHNISKSQDTTKLNFTAGYGFYSGINIGFNYHLKNKTQNIGAFIGFYDALNNNINYFTATAEYNLAIFRKRKSKNLCFKWYLNNKIIYWNMEDRYYYWKVVSFIPSLKKMFYITNRFKVSVDLGPSFNLVLYNKRKTFEKIGWPYHVLPNVRILFYI